MAKIGNQKTEVKRQENAKPGRGGQKPPVTTKPFTKENQPSNEAKKAGWAKRKKLTELLEISTGVKFDGSLKDYRGMAAQFFDIDTSEVTVKMMMEFRQIEKAILKGDTFAYTAVMDRAYGKPKTAEEDQKSLTININGKQATFDKSKN